MADSLPNAKVELEEFAQTREHEYQDPHYHDEDPDIINDEQARHSSKIPSDKKTTTRRPPPKRRYYEE
jgi:hypothetical protein